jgi:hypothetical protein
VSSTVQLNGSVPAFLFELQGTDKFPSIIYMQVPMGAFTFLPRRQRHQSEHILIELRPSAGWLKAEIVFSRRGLQGRTLRMRGPIIILVLMVGILPLDIEPVASQEQVNCCQYVFIHLDPSQRIETGHDLLVR